MQHDECRMMNAGRMMNAEWGTSLEPPHSAFIILPSAFPSLVRLEVDHEHVIQHRAEHLGECLVIGVDEVDVALLLTREGEDEAVCEALVQLFRADVGAPLQ